MPKSTGYTWAGLAVGAAGIALLIIAPAPYAPVVGLAGLVIAYILFAVGQRANESRRNNRRDER
jgi:glucose dehydrogenase